ncbi:phospho-N-acetylmuramoyl-pentapeptide-transferase [Helcobacillus massiliensis]|uniref:Phospho-N-acetylmuramoyl-pentapeptide-transferase n=1 Tax=Helcobacillus massiliensis TaxID=521392 RepID=A0A839QPW6_9MICO|nr:MULTISPECIES: phospho-N-acetylmuramoyl-pentapeptide-transferase [Helcobacillus]MBB3021835.1 phospho-N-acetylmuramoyl-pentapeptide-transferase [Helcobacillus massiliensis]MCG7427131.1 phospho-N-acetylmuramoyl-pentapeptide-transferase [Helcobacillus sp. ACRRO]MCT1557836.1 phospho-N-acetylmuramoyl-pentapeptide-transferase [Helcobacillus massiliensis]MCT2036668.1 phospho-N-acetylmuramoyl-pentapeptide-transferase [Helcobacillus massiliensis]MCT2332139.1 phospho-N-acetylmuramoyl-pentapeptide-tran
MISILIAGAAALILCGFGTPFYIRLLVKKQYGQFVRDDGPTSHSTKRGTPTMGGVAIIGSVLLAYALAHLITWTAPTASGLLVLFLMTGLGALGFADDYLKIAKKQSLGLTAKKKLIGQFTVATVFAVLALSFPDAHGRTPGSFEISFVRDIDWLDLAFAGTTLGIILFALWSNFLVAAWSNGVNLTDGLDGLATGATAIFTGSYVLILFWQWRQSCEMGVGGACYETRNPLDLALVSMAILGACVGFLWWNTSPAKIFMGDTGSLALGGALAGLTIISRTQFIGAIIGGLFIAISLSVIIQVTSFKLTRKRVFRMAPLQHHFELAGWNEVTIVVRFWIVALLCASIGLGLFYFDALTLLPK